MGLEVVLFIYFLIKHAMCLYPISLKKWVWYRSIEKCNSILSCRYQNDFQHDIVVMKASIKPWRQGLEPRLKGHQYASLSRREKLKKWWGLYIELLTEFCGGLRYLFSKRVDTIILPPSFTHHSANFLP